MNIITLISTDSTNRYLNDLAKQNILKEGTVVVTQHQTAGRGQRGNSWVSEAGKNLTFSALLYPAFLPLSQQFLLSEAVALSVCDALNALLEHSTLPRAFRIKWPNDIYYQNRKIAGILIENELTGAKIERSIIGIGLNINQEQFSGNLPNPISLKQITGENTDLDSLLKTILKNMMLRYKQLKSGETGAIRADYHATFYRKENFHLYRDKDGSFSAHFHSVADNGILHLVTQAGEDRFYSFKELSWLP
jgi:BirA family biotin operon repressor/biotin-[acetyl-CoA-carboxylase] ligase